MKRNDEEQAIIEDRIANIELMLSALKNQEEDYEGQWSGAGFVIEYETRNLLQALQQAGVDVPWRIANGI